jgi:hypothetical protein
LAASHLDTLDALYNFACVLNLAGQRENGFRTLRELVDQGYTNDPDHQLDPEPDLKSLRKDPRFAAVVAQMKEHAVADQTQK